jgi:hypothetical protein
MAVVFAALVFAASCGGSGFQYVQKSDDSASTFFKIPDQWTLINVDSDRLPRNRPLPEGARAPDIWQVVFDGDPKPTVDHLRRQLAGHPIGIAESIPVPIEARDTVSLSTLRSLALQGAGDPVRLFQQGQEGLEVVRDEPITTGEGLRGNRVVFNLARDGGRFDTFDQVALHDQKTERVYRLLITCSSRCYTANQDLIGEIVDSWTIKDR